VIRSSGVVALRAATSQDAEDCPRLRVLIGFEDALGLPTNNREHAVGISPSSWGNRRLEITRARQDKVIAYVSYIQRLSPNTVVITLASTVGF
jgi:hypothetical protein